MGVSALYRGQVLPWNIIPTNWRQLKCNNRNQIRIEVLANVLSRYMTKEDAIEFDLFGRIDNIERASAIAQHYGLGTNYIDFSFDPMVAIFFASQKTNTPPPSDNAYGVIYNIPFYKMDAISKIHLSIPPIQARRMFQQFGFLTDFGTPPVKIPEQLKFDQEWMYLQQNCSRVFFRREYPCLEDRDEVLIKEHFLPSNPFLEEVCDKIKIIEITSELDINQTAESITQSITNRPQWYVNGLDDVFIYTDSFFQEIGKTLENYLNAACLLLCEGEPTLDPFMISRFASIEPSIFRGLKEIEALPYGNEFTNTCQLITKSINTQIEYNRKYGGQA